MICRKINIKFVLKFYSIKKKSNYILKVRLIA